MVFEHPRTIDLQFWCVQTPPRCSNCQNTYPLRVLSFSENSRLDRAKARAQPRHRTGAPIGQVSALQEPTGQCTRQIPTANACVVQQEPTLQRRRLRMSCTTAATKLVRARDAAPFACDRCAYRWRRARARLGMLLCMSCSCSRRV